MKWLKDKKTLKGEESQKQNKKPQKEKQTPPQTPNINTLNKINLTIEIQKYVAIKK